MKKIPKYINPYDHRNHSLQF